MFWDNFVSLCNIHKVSPNGVAKQLGFSTGTVTWWKKGRMPRDTALKKIADFFGVTSEYLLGETDNREKPEEKTSSKILEDEPMREKEKQMWDMWHRVPDDQKPQMLKLIEAALAIQLDEYKNGGQKG